MKTNSNKIGIAARLLRAGAIAAIIFSMAACDTGFQHVNKPGQNPGTGSAGAGGEYFYDDLRHTYDRPHEHTLDWRMSLSYPVTCESDGYYEQYCTSSDPRCTFVPVVDFGNPISDPTAHDYVWTETTPATETANGVETEVCSYNPLHTGSTRTAYALGTSSLNYVLYDSEYTVDGVGLSGNVYIAAYYDGLPVTSIWRFQTDSSMSLTILNDLGTDLLGTSQLTTIEPNAFANASLTSILAPGNTSFTVDSGVLYNTGKTRLIASASTAGSFEIPETVVQIDTGVFDGWTALTAITVEGGTIYDAINGILYNHAETTLIRAPEGLTGSVIVPASVETISAGAFKDSRKSIFILT